MKAQYKCIRCYKDWEQTPTLVVCPKCGHKYVLWKNYEECKKNNFR